MTEVQGAPAGGRRLGSSQTVAFDEAAVERILGVRERMAAPTAVRRACVTGGVRGRSCSVAASENGASSRVPAGAPTRCPSRRRQRGNGQCARERPKLAPRRQAWVSRGWIAARRFGATRVTVPTTSSPHGGSGVEVREVAAESPRVKLRARQSGDGTDARVERRLQKLARSIFLVPPRSPRGGRGGAQVARYGGKPMTGQVERAGQKGAGRSSAWTFTGKHENVHSAARSRIESAEGAPVIVAAFSLTGGSRAVAWRSGIVALPDERRVRRANAGTEPRRERPRSDRERQRWRRRVRPPQSKGAGGLQPTTAARCEERHVRSSHCPQSSCAR
jgi:hypothetical protein